MRFARRQLALTVMAGALPALAACRATSQDASNPGHRVSDDAPSSAAPAAPGVSGSYTCKLRRIDPAKSEVDTAVQTEVGIISNAQARAHFVIGSANPVLQGQLDATDFGFHFQGQLGVVATDALSGDFFRMGADGYAAVLSAPGGGYLEVGCMRDASPAAATDN